MVEDNFNHFVQMLNMVWKLLLEHRVRRPNMQLVLSFLERFMNLVPSGETKIEQVPIFINFPDSDKTAPTHPYVYNWKYGNNTNLYGGSFNTLKPGPDFIYKTTEPSPEISLAGLTTANLTSDTRNTLVQQGFNIEYDKKKKEWYIK